MKDFSAHTIGGVELDIDPRAIPPNKMTYANDSDMLGESGGKDLSAFPLPSSLEVFQVGSVSTQFQYVRAYFVDSVTSFTINVVGVTPSPISIPITIGWNYTDFADAINTALNPYGYGAEANDSQGDWFSLAIFELSATPVAFTFEQTNDDSGEVIPIYTLQEYFNPLSSSQAQFKPLQAVQLFDYFLVFSRSQDGNAYGISYASVDVAQNYVCTNLIVSRNFTFSENKVIDIQTEEVNNNQYGVYWTDFNGKPKTLYIPDDMSSPLKYTMDSYETAGQGLFTLESISEQTDLQIQNKTTIAYSSQSESGGSLESGTWFYYSQAGIGRNYSEWSPASEGIPVFSSNTSSPSAGSLIGGDKTPQITSKVNNLTISGINPKVYDTIRVAAVLNQGGAFSAIIVGEFDTIENSNTLDISHSGNESSIEDYDTTALPPVQDVILLAKDMQVKKNRMNMANISVQVDEDLRDIFSNVTLGQTKAELESVGYVTFESSPLIRIGTADDLNTSISTTGEKNIPFTNETAPNFDNGSYYDTVSFRFTAAVTSNYTISYDLFEYSTTTGLETLEIDVYILNRTTNEKYCFVGGSIVGGIITNIKATQNVTLTSGDQLELIYDVKYLTDSGTNMTWQNNSSWQVTQIVSDYAVKSIKVGEYQLPTNVSTKLGYMVNEKYSFYGRVKYKTGFLSSYYPMSQYSFGNGNTLALLPDAYLTDSSGTVDTKVYSYGLTINGLDISTIKDEIDYIEIGRAVCNPTVLGTGIFIPSDSSNGGAGGTFNTGLYTGNTNTAVTYGDVNNSTSANRYFGMMLCPDWATGDIKPQFQSGDYLVVYGVPNEYTSQIIAGGNTKWGSYKEFFGAFTPYAGSPDYILIEDAAYCEWNTPSRILRNDTASKFLAANLNNDGSVTTLSSEGMAMTLGTRINPITSGVSFTDYGCYYVQYVRPNSSQYSVLDDKIVSTNTIIQVDSTTPDTLPEIEVFGGDTYTQKTYMKVLYNALNPDTSKNGTLSSFIGFYSQNKINQQLRYTDKTFTNLPFPFGNTLNNYLFGIYEAGEQFQIDAGYTWYNPLGNTKSYNYKIPTQSSFKARIVYSQQKVLNALQDAYRVILPNDYKDLAAKDGEINGLLDVNDVMIALQPFRVSVLPYQSDVAISGAEVYIGNGGVYAQRENPISTFGATIKSGILLAKNEAGNTQVYWYSKNGKGLMRYGSDGVKSLSNENGWRTWFATNCDFIANEFDVVLGYDQSRTDIFITSRAVNTTIPLWDAGTTYSQGDYVRYSNRYQNFERLTDIYVALDTSTNSNPYNNPTLWEYIPATDNLYYNYWSAIFNEKYNFFRGFFSLLPSRYFNFNGRIMVPRGVGPYNIMYDLFGGDGILQWLDSGGVYKQGTFILEWSSNKNGSVPKRYTNFGVIVGTEHDEANNPSVDISTATQTSDTIGLTDFEYTNGQISAGVLTDSSDDPLISEYAKVRLTSQLYYRVFSMVMTFYNKSRTLFR